jgi:hypothetical protein
MTAVRFLVKLALVLAACAAGQLAFLAVRPVATPPLVQEAEQALSQVPDVLYLGDSSATFTSDADTDKRTLEQMLAHQLPGYTLGSVSHAAYGADMFLALDRYNRALGHHPKLVIAPINMRAFSDSWTKRPGWSWWKEELYLARPGAGQRDLLGFLLSLHVLSPPSLNEEQFLSLPVFDGLTPAGKIRDYDLVEQQAGSDDDSLRKMLIYFYMYELDPASPQLADLSTMQREECAAGTPVLYYVTPIDYETGDRLLGSAFSNLLARNVRVARDRLALGPNLIDLSTAAPTADFGYVAYANEHLNQSGRTTVANAVGARARQLLEAGSGSC